LRWWTWRSSLEEARIEARELHKDLLIDLFNLGDTAAGSWVPTPIRTPRVSRFINEHTVPVQFNVKGTWARRQDTTPSGLRRYCTRTWTANEFPAVVRVAQRGPVPGRILLALAYRFFHGKQFDKSVKLFNDALDSPSSTPCCMPRTYTGSARRKYEGSGISR